MQPIHRALTPSHLAFVAICLLLAAYLPTWCKLWFVAESGHYGGSTIWVWLLLFGLYRRWRPARVLTYAYLLLQILIVVGYILPYTIATGGPILGFALAGSLNLAGLLTLHRSSAIRCYLSSLPPTKLV